MTHADPALPFPEIAPLPDALRADKLIELQLRVARRADEITREKRSSPGLNRHCWLLAEAEITGWFARATGAGERDVGAFPARLQCA